MLRKITTHMPKPLTLESTPKVHWIVCVRKITGYAKHLGLSYVPHVGLRCTDEDQVADIKDIATECGYGDKISVRQKSDGFYVTMGVSLREDRSVTGDWLSTDAAWGKSRRTPNNLIF